MALVALVGLVTLAAMVGQVTLSKRVDLAQRPFSS